LSPGDDYPDYVIPLARAVAAGTVDRGVALCGSGVGASICANKVAGVRAGLIHDVFSAHQGVEDDDMNVFCLGGKVIGSALAWELIETFLKARFSGAVRHQRWIVAGLEGAVVVGGVSAIGAGLVSIGIPKDSVLKYDVALKTDKYVLVVHGTPEEIEKAKNVIAGTKQSHYAVYGQAVLV
jgi:RpiB/LacA/LacB family sugar-phosphate isomerase